MAVALGKRLNGYRPTEREPFMNEQAARLLSDEAADLERRDPGREPGNSGNPPGGKPQSPRLRRPRVLRDRPLDRASRPRPSAKADFQDRRRAETPRRRHLRLLRGDRRADQPETARRPPDRDAIDRGAGAARAARAGLSRRIKRRAPAGAFFTSDEPRKIPPPQAHLRPDADRETRPAVKASRRKSRDFRQARRLQCRPRLRRQQGPKNGISGAGRAGAGLRHARHHRRHPVEPYASGGGDRCQARIEMPARAGELGRLSRRRLRPRRQYFDEPADGRACRARRRRLWHQFQAELGAGAGGGAERRRKTLRDSGRRFGPQARRARLCRLCRGGEGARGVARLQVRLHLRLLGDRLDTGRHGRRLCR